MEEELRALLLADATVAGIAGDRVNFGAHPQGAALPALVLSNVSDNAALTMQGAHGMVEARVQVDCYALTYGAAKTLGRAVHQLLHAHRGGGFLFIEYAGGRDGREGGANEAERAFRVSMDFLTSWRPE